MYSKIIRKISSVEINSFLEGEKKLTESRGSLYDKDLSLLSKKIQFNNIDDITQGLRMNEILE